MGRTRSVALAGLGGQVVDVEAHVAQGLPHFLVTGLPDKACAQAPDRVRAATASIGAPLPPRRLTVNLSPASIPKVGTGFDLPIAVAVLRANGVIRSSRADATVHIGELGLDGRIRAVRGVLPAVLAAAREGVTRVVVPPGNVAEARLVDGVRVHSAPDLGALVSAYAAFGASPLPLATEPDPPTPEAAGGLAPDLADVVGQGEARLCLELAAAGGHHLLMNGPPGVGKTMLAERLVTILPPLTREQALETHAVRSLVGGLGEVTELDLTPPFVAPHHSASMAAIVGGGSGQVLPGAVSRANWGVLFLDEAAEFKSSVLQTLRQPLESGEVVIARARQVVRYPARFLLALATNPCPCGRGWGKAADCTCRSQDLRHYLGRIGAPLLDRIDLQVIVPPVQHAFGGELGESSALVAARVERAREVQLRRWGSHGWVTNGSVPGHALRRPPFRLERRATVAIDRALDHGRLTLRGYDRVLRVAWSLADVAGTSVPGASEVALALTLRQSTQVAA